MRVLVQEYESGDADVLVSKWKEVCRIFGGRIPRFARCWEII